MISNQLTDLVISEISSFAKLSGFVIEIYIVSAFRNLGSFTFCSCSHNLILLDFEVREITECTS